MGNPFDADKQELMEQVLDHLGVRYSPTRSGWQPVSCPSNEHANGDRNPSASVNITYGYFACHACDLRGDGFELMLKVRGVKAPQVREAFTVGSAATESEWLI